MSTNSNDGVNKPQAPRLGAVGMLRNANSFFLVALSAREALNQKKERECSETNFVLYYLYSHAIELALKSFLMIKGFSDDALKKIGHNLEKVLDVANENGLKDVVDLLPEEKKVICWASRYYEFKAFEYPITGYYKLPELQYFHSVNKSLITKLEPYIDKEARKALKNNGKSGG